MPPKRRLSDDSAEGDRDTSVTPEPGKKRKKIDPQQQMQSLYDFLRKYRLEDGSELCEPFIRAPKRRTDPEYYEVVSDPIDMLRIQQKLKTEEYVNVQEVKADLQKLIDNALAFYKDGNDEREKATEMQELLDKAWGKIANGEDPMLTLSNREESEVSELGEMLEDMLTAVVTATDPSDSSRNIHTVFKLLPSQKRYPEYYEVIKDPMDLKTIATKIQNDDYESLSEMENDLSIMCKNAMHFNEPGSIIYKDAKLLSKLVKSKKLELEANKVARENRGSRSTRRLQGKKHFSEELAELTYEDSESEESEEENVDTSDPLWALYAKVRYYETPSGVSLAEPFLTLPSKREFPDYYDVVEDPISLNQIRKKLKSEEYNDLQELADDLNTMIENCKSYNRADSRLYKDGVKLQKVFQAKLEELQMDDEDEDMEVEAKTADVSSSGDEKGQNKSPGKDALKKRLKVLYNAVLQHKTRDGIELIGMFMEKPSKRDYPDYYEIIANPIDMKIINERIKNGHYKNEEDLIQDMKLMFTNCKTYNEEGSAIYEDANTLERVLMAKARDMGVVQAGRRGRRRTIATKDIDKIKTLFETVRDHKDPKGRQLCLIFLKLPNPKDMPEYFEVIKNPIDFEVIGNKMKQVKYQSLEDCLNDFVLMFDNACKFNEPDSQIYKDALTLQNLAHRTFRRLQEEDENTVPDVHAAVQELLSFIFISMYNHQDAEERCYSDSLQELPEYDVGVDGKKKGRALSLDLVKRRLDKALYKRLDTFQRDIFAVLERARNLSRSDSQIFEDSVELQTQFIRVRDEACRNVLESKALLYTVDDLTKEADALKATKQQSELPEEDEHEDGQGNEELKKEGGEQDAASTNSATFNQQQYTVGDFVYTEGPEKGMEAYIFLIESVYKSKETGEQLMYGNRFFRPIETFHVSSRKFLENEVFRTDVHQSVPLNKIVGRCVVVPIKDYFKMKPEGFEDKDVFVCESRYQSRHRSFKKLKAFWALPSHIKLVNREAELEPKRVMSVFKERIEKHKEELEEIEAMVNSIADFLPQNIVWKNPQGQEGYVYYEQFTIPGPVTLRRGDYVYVRAENGKNLIAQIDTMWTGPDNMAYFNGPWFVRPAEMPPQTENRFYKQESFLSTISDTNPLLSVVGKCTVLEMKEYKTRRQTQYLEADVFVCESVYDESRRMVRGPLPEGLKHFAHSPDVVTDEVYIFKNQIIVQKEAVGTSQSSVIEIDNEDSLDAPPSVGSTDNLVPSTPYIRKGPKSAQKKTVTPYILFSSEIRKRIAEENKGRAFGEISRLVGDKWKQLSDSQKASFEERAKKINEENAVRIAEEQRLAEQRRKHELSSSTPSRPQSSLVNGFGSQVIATGLAGQQNQQVLRPMQTMSPSLQRNAMHPALAKQVEPVFHTVPPRPQRLLHSEAYIRYIESLNPDSNTMGNWEKQLCASKTNTRTDEAKLPAHWLADNGDHGTSMDALWALREFMMGDSIGLAKIM